MSNSVQHVFFFDSRVVGWQDLIAQLPAESVWFEIGSQTDGVQQVVEALDGLSDLDSIQIISHGAPGLLALGSTLVDIDSLDTQSEQWAQIGQSLSASGDILLYGCEVGSGEDGLAFIDRLGALTGADVAANTDITGLGGDWTLDAVNSSGAVETEELAGLASVDRLEFLVLFPGDPGDPGVAINPLEPSQWDTLDAGLGLDANGANTKVVANVVTPFTSYEWRADGVMLAGTGQTGRYLLLDASLAGKSITVTGVYAGGTLTSLATAPVVNDNDTPTGEVSIAGLAAEGSILTATNNLIDLDFGSTNADVAEFVSYQWLANGVAIEGALSDTLVLTQAQVGQVISVQATYTDRFGTIEVVSSGYTPAVSNVSHSPGGSLTVVGTAREGNTLTAINAISDADGLDGVVFSYQWQASGDNGATWADIAGATADTLSLSQAEVGQGIRVVARFVDGEGAHESVSSSAISAVSNGAALVANVNDAPSGGVSISGTNTQGQTLLANVSALADADGIALGVDGRPVLAYQWYANGVAIAGAMSATFTLTQAQVGSTVHVKVSYTDLQGTAEVLTSATTFIIGDGNDAPTGGVTITVQGGGPIAQGETLVAHSTLRDADGFLDLDQDTYADVSYQWFASSEAIDGATGRDLFLTPELVGQSITVKASFVDGDGKSESVLSASTAAVADVDSGSVSGTLEAQGIERQGFTLTVRDRLEDPDGVALVSYEWLYGDGTAITRSTIAGGAPVAVRGESLVLTQAEVGQTIVVKATVTDVLGNEVEVYSPVTGTIADTNDDPRGAVTVAVVGGGVLQEGATLQASSAGLSDADGMGGVYYQWFTVENFAPGAAQTLTRIDGAYGSTLTLTQAQVGKAIVVEALYVDGQGNQESVLSASTAAVADVDSGSVSGTLEAQGIERQGFTLTVRDRLEDPDGVALVSYEWLYGDGTAITRSTIAGGAPVAVRGESLVLTQAEVGQTIVVKATVTDVLGNEVEVYSPVTGTIGNANDAATGAVTISVEGGGPIAEGKTLVASSTLLDSDGFLDLDQDGYADVDYQWFANGLAIDGAIGRNLLLTPSLVGQSITVKASFVDGDGALETVASPSTAVVSDGDTGEVTGTLDIAGEAKQGATLTVDSTLVDQDGLIDVHYAWLHADGTPVLRPSLGGADPASPQAASGPTLLLTQDQVGQTIVLKATVTDSLGNTSVVYSPATGPVANVNDAPTGVVLISGTPIEGEKLSADASSVSDADGMGGFSFQWMADGQVIPGASFSELLLSQDQVGKRITVEAMYTDGYGAVESVLSASTDVVQDADHEGSGSVTIVGTARQGATLMATHDLADPDGLGTVRFQWFADDQPINGATGASLYLPQSLVGTIISVTGSYTDGRGTAVSVSSPATFPVENVNDPPTGRVQITGIAMQGEVLTATNTLRDVDGLGGIRYEWYASGTLIDGQSSDTLRLTQTMVGKWIQVRAVYVDEWGTSESVASGSTAAVANAQVAPTGAVVINGNLFQGQTLSAIHTLSDDDGLGEVSYRWFANDVQIAVAGGSILALDQTLVDKAIRVEARYTDGDGKLEVVSSVSSGAVANVNDAPIGFVSITGTARQGQQLVANTSISDADGLPLDADDQPVFIYQWFADGETIQGATASTLTLDQALVGKSLAVVVSYTDEFGTAESVRSSTTGTVANVNDPPTGAVTIVGAPEPGRTLSISQDLADVDGMGTLTYQWRLNGLNINNATSPTLALTADMVGKSVSVSVSYPDGQGTLERVTSLNTPVRAQVEEEATGTLSFVGDLMPGSSLTATLAGVSDPDGATTTQYRWQRLMGTEWVDVSGANTATLVAPANASFGTDDFRVVATTTDALGGTTEFVGRPYTAGLPQGGLAALEGQVYHWKSHTLLAGAVVESMSVPSTSGGTPAAEELALRNVSFDRASGALSVEVWMKSASIAASVDFGVKPGFATGLSFDSNLPTNWNALANTTMEGGFRFGAFVNQGSGLTGEALVGTLTMTLPARLDRWTVEFDRLGLGGAALRDLSLSYDATSTDSSGAFATALLRTGPVQVQASLSGGEAGLDAAVTAADARAALLLALGMNPNPDPDGPGPMEVLKVSPYQIMAADVNDSGSVTLQDALAILRMAVGAPSSISPEWLFVEESRGFWDPVSQRFNLDQDASTWDRHITLDHAVASQTQLVGVVLGDVNGSWQGSAAAPKITDVDAGYFTNLAASMGVPLDQWGVYPG